MPVDSMPAGGPRANPTAAPVDGGGSVEANQFFDTLQRLSCARRPSARPAGEARHAVHWSADTVEPLHQPSESELRIVPRQSAADMQIPFRNPFYRKASHDHLHLAQDLALIQQLEVQSLQQRDALETDANARLAALSPAESVQRGEPGAVDDMTPRRAHIRAEVAEASFAIARQLATTAVATARRYVHSQSVNAQILRTLARELKTTSAELEADAKSASVAQRMAESQAARRNRRAAVLAASQDPVPRAAAVADDESTAFTAPAAPAASAASVAPAGAQIADTPRAPDPRDPISARVAAAAAHRDAANAEAHRLGQEALAASVMPGISEDEQRRRWQRAVTAAGTAFEADRALVLALSGDATRDRNRS